MSDELSKTNANIFGELEMEHGGDRIYADHKFYGFGGSERCYRHNWSRFIATSSDLIDYRRLHHVAGSVSCDPQINQLFKVSTMNQMDDRPSYANPVE